MKEPTFKVEHTPYRIWKYYVYRRYWRFFWTEIGRTDDVKDVKYLMQPAVKFYNKDGSPYCEQQ